MTRISGQAQAENSDTGDRDSVSRGIIKREIASMAAVAFARFNRQAIICVSCIGRCMFHLMVSLQFNSQRDSGREMFKMAIPPTLRF
jgi:hypothetical protein